jgi:hypothetical protein
MELERQTLKNDGRLAALAGLVFLGFAYYPRFLLALSAKGLYNGDVLASYLGLVLVFGLGVTFFARRIQERALDGLGAVFGAGLLGLSMILLETMHFRSSTGFAGLHSYLAYNKVLIGVLTNVGLFAFILLAFRSSDEFSRFIGWLFKLGVAFLGAHVALHLFLRISLVFESLEADWAKTFLSDNHMSYECVGLAVMAAAWLRGHASRFWAVLAALGAAGTVSWLNSTRGGILISLVLGLLWLFLNLPRRLKLALVLPGLLVIGLWGQQQWRGLSQLSLASPDTFDCSVIESSISADNQRSLYYRAGGLALGARTAIQGTASGGIGGYRALDLRFCGVRVHSSLVLVLLAYGLAGLLFLGGILAIPSFVRREAWPLLGLAAALLVSLFENQILWWFSILPAGALLAPRTERPAETGTFSLARLGRHRTA